MNVYDFDKTIYKNDSTAELFKFLYFKNIKLWFYLPAHAVNFLLFATKRITKTEFKERLYSCFKCVKNIEEEVELFWDKNENGVFDWYKEKHKEDDVVISASPEFLIKPICKRLGIVHALASRVDCKTGKYTGLNCHGEEKVRRLNEYMSEYIIDEFYSDSYSDTPLAKLAKKSFMIKKGEITPWKFK